MSEPEYVDCPNPKCNKGHEWQKGDEECSCPVVKDWVDQYPHGGYWDGFKEHDKWDCETLCRCCYGAEAVTPEEAQEWLEAQEKEKQT